MRLLSLFLLLMITSSSNADPEKDKHNFKEYYQKLFPQLTLKDYAEGVYSLDPISRESWLAIEEFPPYELAIEKGQQLFKMPFKNGKTYADCFENKGIGITQNYPKWDEKKAEVQTLAKAINDCRVTHNESKFLYKKIEIAQISAYMANSSRGKMINVHIPKNTPKALAAYEQGKDYYYQRRGQLNFSCASCHIQNAGKRLRAEILSPALGHTSGWPTYRLKWGEIGTLHRRFIGCHKQIRAKLPQAQSIELRNLEYFLTFMGNGIPLNAPSTRK